MFEESWAVAGLYSGLITLCMALTALLCLCGCKAKERKDELVGIEGHVKMTNPDIVDTHEPNGKAIVITEAATVKRSLPDLPANSQVSWEPGGDTTSELYATVGVQKSVKIETAGPSNGQEHPYDKLKNVEHPYAQVLAGEAPSTSAVSASPRPPPREIAAASAISGQIHASDDLPYMTPPTHFSGDSQDSAKGYTSISVREPLAAIRAETTQVQNTAEHYTTVSDDSDDMYAAIDDPASGSETYAQIQPAIAVEEVKPPVDYSQVRAVPVRTSVTPAQSSHSRQESSSSATSTVHSPKPEKREANSPLPAPPATPAPAAPGEERSVDDMYAKVNKKGRRREVEQVLERGPSTESAITGSSESVSYRLQSNHISTTDSSASCHGVSTSSTSELPGTSSLSTHSRSTSESPSPRRADPRSDSSLSSDETRGCYERLQDDPQYETLNKKGNGYEKVKKENVPRPEPGYQSLDNSDMDPQYETLGGNINDPCYATLKKPKDPGYETLNNGLEVSEPNYETLGRGPPSDSDPNYERIGQHNENYESLPDGYATVNKNNNSTDPTYAVVSSDVYAAVVKQNRKIKNSPYASIGGDGNVLEPPYASLQGEGFTSEPEYESVQFGNSADPPYQLLADFESGAAQK